MMTNEVCMFAHVTPRQVNYWCNAGMPGLERHRFPQSGYSRHFTSREFRVLRLAANLNRLGISLQKINEYMTLALEGQNIWYDKDEIAFVAVPAGMLP